MATKKPNTSLQNALQGRMIGEGHPELQSDIKELLDTLDGEERVEAVIERVQRYAVEAAGKSADSNFHPMGKNLADEIKKIIGQELAPYVSSFITDVHRELAVSAHARGLSTSDAVRTLILEDRTMFRMAQDDAVGLADVRTILIHRLSYLKPGTARWPEAKYGSVWREAREEYRQQVSDIPFTSKAEQVALLAKNAERINRALDNEEHSVKDFQLLTNSLTKTMESLRKLSAVEQPMPVSLSGPQLVGVLERLTVALRAPGQLELVGETQELVAVLEGLTLALKAPQGKSNGNGVKALPAAEGREKGKQSDAETVTRGCFGEPLSG